MHLESTFKMARLLGYRRMVEMERKARLLVSISRRRMPSFRIEVELRDAWFT